MRVAIYVALLVACVAAAPDLTRAALASAAAVLLETLPYAAAAAMLRPLLGRLAPNVVAYAGCGCSTGPGARSIPAAFACAALFGPYVALARWMGAIAVSILQRGSPHRSEHDEPPLLGDLATIALAALLAGAMTVAAPMLALAHRSPLLQCISGVMLGFAAAPCALGGVALASALHAQSPLAAYTMLGVAGVIDLRVWWRARAPHVGGDRTTYATLALACAIVAYEHGASLIHPRMVPALWGCAVFGAYLAIRTKSISAPLQRFVAASLVAIALIGSPPPPPVTTEATLDTLYPGERIDFTGEYQRNAGVARVVRYAITCCRADARPVCIVLAHPIAVIPDAWLKVRGVVQRRGDELVLATTEIRQIAPPTDPFVYL